jgi:hypothetical protein
MASTFLPYKPLNSWYFIKKKLTCTRIWYGLSNCCARLMSRPENSYTLVVDNPKIAIQKEPTLLLALFVFFDVGYTTPVSTFKI